MNKMFEGFDINMVKPLSRDKGDRENDNRNKSGRDKINRDSKNRKKAANRENLTSRERNSDKYKNEKSREDPQGIQQSHAIENDRLSIEANCGEPCLYTHPQGCCSGCSECIDQKLHKWLKDNENAPDITDKEGKEIGVSLILT